MTNTPPEIDKYGTYNKMTAYKNGTTKSSTLKKWHKKDA